MSKYVWNDIEYFYICLVTFLCVVFAKTRIFQNATLQDENATLLSFLKLCTEQSLHFLMAACFHFCIWCHINHFMNFESTIKMVS